MAKEFYSVCPSLKVVSFYGGTSIGNQFRDLERGVDVVVGTPGRIIDLIERKALKLDLVRGVLVPGGGCPLVSEQGVNGGGLLGGFCWRAPGHAP